MATGVGFSFDTSFLKNLEKADAKMASLMDKSNQASRSIVSAFQQMNNQGVVPFVQSLEKQKQTLDSVFDAITTKTGKARKGYEGMASSVVDATNAIVSLISKMKSTSQYQLDTKLTGLSSQIKELQEYQERQRQVKVASEQAMNAELDKYRQLIERVRELNSIKAQSKEIKTTSTDKELVKDANKAQREANAELRILKEQQKQIEQKYAVETALIRKQADAQSFQDKVRQAKDAEKAVEAEIKREQEAYLKSLSEKIRAQQEYAQRMKELEQARIRQQSANRRASYKLDVVGGTGMNAADQALRYADRIYSDRGLRSVNNMQKAIQQMQQAQQRLNLNTEQGRQKYEQLDKEIKRVKGDIDRVTGASENLNKSHKGLLDTSSQLARAMAAVFSVSAIRGYVNKLMQIRGEFELQQRSLQVLLQNKDEANALWDKTVALAVKSPYTTKQLVTATKQLAAYRVESEKLYETNKMLADVSIGLGVDMNRLILAFGQVKAANFLRGTELRQFSEAGVNMLDELAKRFTMLEGRAVSVGEVFERVSKRMVSFADVEAVFKTITSEGGTFYQMQEKQSETLKGMMLNLKDSYELMLNDIGKSNEGMLKGFVSMMKSLVDNWQTLSRMLKGVGAALVLYKLSVASTNRDLIVMALQMGVVNKTGTKQLTILNLLTLGFKKLTKGVKGAGGAMKAFMASNAITLTITAIVYALYELYNAFSKHQEQLEEITTQYKELRREVTDISVKFTYASNIEEQKAELSKLIGVTKDKYNLNIDIDVKGLDEQEVSEKFNNLRNEILNTMAFAEQMSKAIVNSDTWFGNMFTDGIKADFKEFSESAQELSTTLRNEVNMLIEYLEKSGKLTDEFKEAFKPRTKDESELEYITRVKEAYQKLIPIINQQRAQISYKYALQPLSIFDRNRKTAEEIERVFGRDLVTSLDKISGIIKTYDRDLSEATSEFNEFADSVENIINSIPEEGRTVAVKTAIDQQGFDDFTREMWYRLANERFGINITPKMPQKKEVTGWVKEYNKFIGTLKQGVDKEGNTLAIVKPMQADTDPTEYLNKLKGTYERLQKDVEAWDAKNAKARAQYTEDEINAIKAQNAERKKAIDWLEYDDKKKNKKLKKQIQLVRQLADDYEEMWKKYGKAYADANIKSVARRNAFAELELDIDDFVVGTRQDEKSNLGKLLEKALGIEGGKVEVEKAVADVEVEVRWDLQEQANANLSREFENLFGNYELSLELEKLNIPPDLAKQLFGIDSIDLTTLRKELLNKVGLGDMVGKTNADILNSNAYEKLNEPQLKELADHLQKVSQMEQKEQEERLKKYIAFSRKAMSERAKIKFEELQTIAEIEKTFAIRESDSEEVKATKRAEEAKAKAQARKEAKDALQKLDWEDFKSSDTFNNIFDDLEHASDEVLKNVIQQLKDFKNQWKDMPFEQMRQVVDLLNKAEGALEESSNPFMEGTRLNKVIRKDGRTAQEAQLDIWQAEQQKRIAEEALSNYEIFEKVSNGQLKVAELSTEQQKEYAYWQALSVEQREELVGEIQDEVSAQNEAINKSNIHLNNIKKQKASYEAQAQAIEQMNQMAQDLYNSFKGLHEALGGDSDSPEAIFAEMGMSVTNSVASMIQLQLELQAASVSATAFGAAMNTALGVIGWINMGVSVLTSVITAFTKAHDNKREKQIQKELDLVERLGKLYEKLEKQIEAAYSIDTFQAANDAANKNLEQQYKSYEDMIAAEEDKKKTDHERIEEWRKVQEEILEKQEELERDRLQSLGGVGGETNYKDAAQSFVDAWLEAFKETGNGIEALDEEFNSMLENIVKRQLLLRATDSFLTPIFNEIDKAVKDTEVTTEEMNDIKELAGKTLPELDKFLEELANDMGLSDLAGSTSELSGLSAGIQGMSAEQADILAAYWSSSRFLLSTIDNNVRTITENLGINAEVENPMLPHLRTIAEQTAAINSLLNSLTAPHPTQSGRGLKVII